MNSRYYVLTVLPLLLASGQVAAQLPQQYKVLFSTTSLTPRGLYGSEGISSRPDYLYPLDSQGGVFVGTYPLVSFDRTIFARFEQTATARKLVFRRLLDGATVNSYAVNGYNPQWWAGGNLFYEKPPSGGLSELWGIDDSSGSTSKFGAIGGQFYPPGETAGAAVLHPNGTSLIYHKGATPYIFTFGLRTERPLFSPDSRCLFDRKLYRRARLSSGPPPPLTIRHMNWSPDGSSVLLFGGLALETFKEDPAHYWDESRQGIFLVEYTRNPVRITTVYATDNVSRDHPENFFFSPSGRLIAFNARVDNKTRLFTAKPRVPNSASEIAVGSIVAGAASKEYWALSPWSPGGSAILYQDDTDGSLWSTGPSGSGKVRLTPEGLPGRFSVADAQWVGFEALPPASTNDLVVTDVVPVQVIEDAPLIKHKATMVRVYVSLTGQDTLEGVAVDLRFGKESVRQTATLRNHAGQTYVLPPSEVEDFERERLRDGGAGIRSMFLQKGYTSFNFLGPFLPDQVGDFPVVAVVDPDDRFDEKNEGNNDMMKVVTVKPFFKDAPASPETKAYSIAMIPARPVPPFVGPTPHVKSRITLSFQAEWWSQFVQAVYPIPKVDTFFSFSAIDVPYIPIAYPITISGLQAGALVQFEGGYDRVALILPKGSLGSDILGLTRPAISDVVLLDEMAPQITLAHEMGHTYGLDHDYDDDSRVSGGVAADGWDVLGLTRNDQGRRRGPIISLDRNTRTPGNFYSLMQGAPPLHPWITRDQYESLLNELVTGGANPRAALMRADTGSNRQLLEVGAAPAVLVRGVFFDDGRMEFLPTYVAEATLKPVAGGEFSITTFDPNGNALASVPFDTAQIPYDSGRTAAVFAVKVPYSPFTGRIAIMRGPTVLREIRKTSNLPVVTVHPAEDLGGGRFRISWEASDTDLDSLSHTVLYSHDGNSFRVLAVDITRNSIEIDSSAPGGTGCVVKVVTTDGLNTVRTFSPAFAVPTKAPEAMIIFPADGWQAVPVEPVTLEGFAIDPEQGPLPDSAMTWQSDVDGFLGVGKLLETMLSAGTHHITLTATDDEGKIARATTTISANPSLVIRNAKVNPVNGLVSFDWIPAPGKTYAVERNNNLTDPGGWSTIGTNLTSGAFTDANPEGGHSEYYRLRIE